MASIIHPAPRPSDSNLRCAEALLATLSHKMRGPLNSISAWAQLLRSGRLGAEASHQALDAIVRGVQAETRILDDVLDLVRISSGTAQLESRPLAIAGVLLGALDAVEAAASLKGVEIRRPGPSPAWVLGDRDRLEQVFTNLLTNAIRYTPPGGYVEVEVEIDARESVVEVRINDSGQGIAAEALPQLFATTAPAAGESPGSAGGLGLAIVESLVQRHGGAIRASSAGPGLGASFVVRLPSQDGAPGT